jgi:2-polyprenyl-6-methoxyphenol hydroxylase-like FAD-dependent oxidoreductase
MVTQPHPQAQRYPSLTRNEGEVDILIIGAGITGLLTAYYLAKQGGWVKVTVLQHTCTCIHPEHLSLPSLIIFRPDLIARLSCRQECGNH